jgi:hypothetical protein
MNRLPDDAPAKKRPDRHRFWRVLFNGELRSSHRTALQADREEASLLKTPGAAHALADAFVEAETLWGNRDRSLHVDAPHGAFPNRDASGFVGDGGFEYELRNAARELLGSVDFSTRNPKLRIGHETP